MSEMVDRVAKRLAEHCNGGEFESARWYNGDQRDVWRKAARAAIEAMREPDERMLFEGHRAIRDAQAELPSRAGWSAMIDAALKD